MLNLRITQPFEKMIDDPNYQYSSVIFEVGRIEARGKITFLTQGHNKCYFGDKSVHADEEVLKMYKAGRYFVRIKIMWKMPEKYNRAVLSVFTSSTVVFTKM